MQMRIQCSYFSAISTELKKQKKRYNNKGKSSSFPESGES